MKKRFKTPELKLNKITADVIFYDSKYLDKRLYHINTYLLNTLNFDYELFNKGILFENICKQDKTIAKQYFIETFKINEIDNFFNNLMLFFDNISYSLTESSYIFYKKIKYYKINLYLLNRDNAFLQKQNLQYSGFRLFY